MTLVILSLLLCLCGLAPPGRCELLVKYEAPPQWIAWAHDASVPEDVVHDLDRLRESIRANVTGGSDYSLLTSDDGLSLYIDDVTIESGNPFRRSAGVWIWPDWRDAETFVHLPGYAAVQRAGSEHLRARDGDRYVAIRLKTTQEFILPDELFRSVSCSSQNRCAGIDGDGWVVIGSAEDPDGIKWTRTKERCPGAQLVWTRSGDFLLIRTDEEDVDRRRLLVMDQDGTVLDAKQMPVRGIAAAGGHTFLYHLSFDGEYLASVTEEGKVGPARRFVNWRTRVVTVSPSGRFATINAPSLLTPAGNYELRRLPGVARSQEVPKTVPWAIHWLSWCRDGDEDDP